MKKYLIFAASALALASCSSDDFVGDNSGNLHGTTNGEIAFAGGTAKITRAGNHVGADAAKLLNNQFIVAGFKGEKLNDGIVANKVFDHYTVEWVANSAGTTADNTSDWKYVGLKPQAGLSGITEGKQTIKYWDYSTGQYDYIAFSTGAAKLVTATEPTNGEVKVTKVDAGNAKKAAYTIKGTAEDLSKCYIADLITAYNPKIDGKPEYQKEVTLSFRNLTTKVRVALYETIPGYSVKDVKFYSNGNDDNNEAISEKSATLFASGVSATDNFYGSGTATVFFPTVGTDNINNTDYNKAHVAIEGSDKSTSKNFGNLDYTKSDDPRLGTEKIYLSTKSSEATYATDKDHYEIALPNEAGTTLTLRVNYTLVANDGSGEKINVYGAKAIIPAIYAQWKSNYAYTYIFKISDKTNGLTGLGANTPEGLYPITFDAVVAKSEEGNQSTITTVATPSITTYQKGHDITKDEYSAADKEIYVMVSDENGALKTDLNNAKLYTVTTTGTTISEATVHDALTIGVTKDEASKDNVKGRNGITLTKADLNTDITTIPGVDGNDIKVNQESKHDAVSFTPDNTTNETKTYAFVYQTKDGTDDKFVSTYTPETDKTVEDNTYYTNIGCTETAGTSLTAGTTYYYKVNKNTNTYAVKVIKVVK